MKIKEIRKIEEKYPEWDITTQNGNFYIDIEGFQFLIHNSPAIFFGKDPNNGEFFVGTKSVLGKNPKINHSHEEVDRNHSGELAKKLKEAYTHLKSIYFGDKVYQMDMLFGKGDKSNKNIGGKPHIVFRPNTILYAVPVDPKSDLYKDISKAKFGGVVHTVYEASPGETGIALRQSNPTLSKELAAASEGNSSIYLTHPFHNSLDDLSMDSSAEKKINKLLKSIEKEISNVRGKFDNVWKAPTKTKMFLTTYLNSQLRQFGNSIFQANIENKKFKFDKFARGFERFIEARFAKELAKLKSDKARDAKEKNKRNILRAFRNNRKNFEPIMNSFFMMLTIKNILLNEFASIQSKLGKTFVVKGDKYEAVKPEGFVLVGGEGAIKMVDRLEFSRNNFLYGAF